MIRPGISRQLLIAGTVPAAVVTVIVGAWLMMLRIADMREHQIEVGEAVATQLAPAAEYGVFSGNTAVLRRLAEGALNETHLRSVTIRDRAGVALARAVKEHDDSDAAAALSRWLAARFVDADATVRFTAPVVQPLTDLGEFDVREMRADEAEIGSVEIEIALLPAFANQLDALLTGAAILFGGLMVSLLLAGRLGERIAEPIQRLADAMRRVRDGDLGVRVPQTSTNEIGLLESGLNRMADEVQRTQRTLEDRVARATSDLRETVGALEVSNVELDLARRRALEASHLKSEFLAAMSHEIRTPMSGIIGFADLLSRTGLTREQLEQVRTIRKSADALMRILNDILDLSRIEAGKLVLADEAFDVRACIDEVLSLMAPLAYAKGLQVHRGVGRDVPWQLRGDPMRIRQVVTNLVSNAIKYTPAGAVTLEASLDAAHPPVLRICVRDTGVGIAAAVQHQLFQAFSQPTLSTAHYPGAGLGLVICNKLVEAMGGEISLDSAPGEGSTFAVTLHLRDAPQVTRTPRWPGVSAVVSDPDPLTRDHVAQLLESDGVSVTAVSYEALAAAPRADLLVLGLPEIETTDIDGLRVAAAGFRHALLLAGTHDATLSHRARAALAETCIARCAAPGTLHHALATLLDDAPAPPPTPQVPDRRLAGIAALVVDDNRVNRVLSCRQLEALGAEVESAADGPEGLACCGAKRYDVVLLDLQMPGMDGVAVARSLRDAATAPIVVAVTANAQPAVHRYPFAAGINAVLLKPVDTEVLSAVILREHERRALARAGFRALDAEIRHMLAEDLPLRARAFHLAALAGDAAALRTEAHALRGISAVCHLDALANALARLEAGVRDGSPLPEDLLADAGAELIAAEAVLQAE